MNYLKNKYRLFLGLPAVVCKDKKISFKELDEKSELLSKILLDQNPNNNYTVGIRLERSLELIISIFACIKAGLTYILIEKTLPFERVAYILQNSNCELLITSKELNTEDFGVKTYTLSKQETTYNYKNENKVANENLCIIYTSGSTGNPKGVLLTQKGFINLVFAMDNSMNLKSCNNFLSHASVSFDMFAFELYCSLLLGKTLFLTDDIEQKDPISISNIIQNNNIDFILATPSKIELMLDNDKLSACLSYIKVFLFGGEVFTSNLYNRIKPKTNGDIFNGYGPTEITACCSIKKVESANDITIGKPVDNSEIYILDNSLSLCPVGVSGEICVAGAGLAIRIS